jgi:hypothetical protein
VPASQLVTEQRGQKRVPLILSAQISVRRDSLVQPCIVSDISASGAGLLYELIAPRQEMVGLLEITGIGRFHGVTVHAAGRVGGFSFLHGEAERNNLLHKLVTLIERGVTGETAERRKSVREPATAQLILTLPSGATELCQVLDLSLDGVYLSTKSRPPVGHLLRVGALYARVMCHRDDGIGMKFISFVGL